MIVHKTRNLKIKNKTVTLTRRFDASKHWNSKHWKLVNINIYNKSRKHNFLVQQNNYTFEMISRGNVSNTRTTAIKTNQLWNPIWTFRNSFNSSNNENFRIYKFSNKTRILILDSGLHCHKLYTTHGIKVTWHRSTVGEFLWGYHSILTDESFMMPNPLFKEPQK